MSNYDGGQAFPVPHNGHNGMSLRDKFADSAIALFPITEGEILAMEAGVLPLHENVAHFCYSLADAMLEERKK